MELNLNELERRAKSAGGQEWTLTIDATGDAFLSAENSEYVAEVGAVGEDGIVSDYGKFIAAANPAVVLELVRRLREAEARVAELEAERAGREAGKLLAYLSNDRTQFFIPSMEGKDVKHAPYMAHWMAGWTPLYAATPVTAPAVGYVNALRYIAWEAAGYMDCVHAAKRAIGETGALPPPPKSQQEKGRDSIQGEQQ